MSLNSITSVVVKEEPVSEPPFIEDGTPKECQDHKIGKPEFISVKIEPNFEISIKQEPILFQTPLQPKEEPIPASETNEIDNHASDNEFKIDVTVKTEKVDIEIEDYTENGTGESMFIDPHTSNEYYKEIRNDHMLFLNPNQPKTCPICLKHFANMQNAKRHLLLHARVKYECVKCNKQYLSEEKLKTHPCKYDIKNIHQCPDCEKTFKCSSKLKQHSRVHLTEKPYVCDICRRAFTTEMYLVKHQRKSRCKKPRDEPLTCHVCLKDFEKEFLLKSHLRKHDTDRPYTCDMCGMNFKYKSAVARHLQWHNGIRPYSCKYCKKTFVHSGLLKPHLRTHTGEKPYKCTICEKRFTHKHNMQRHALRHCKIKKLVCEICHKKFPRESRLIYHMRTHLNVKGFSCQVCNKTFSHRQNILRHYKRKHPGATYDCKDTDAKLAIKVWDSMKHIIAGEPEEILS